MKIHFYGTGASEGVPAMFCECEYCTEFRKIRGKNIRMRTCAQVDDRIMIDFSMDSYAQSLFYGLDLIAVSHILFTHSHEDHLHPASVAMVLPPKAFHCRERQLHVYGNEKVVEKIQSVLQAGMNSAEELEHFMDSSQNDPDEYLKLHMITKEKKFHIEDYQVIPLAANHDPKEECMIYLIQQGGKTLLYGHDSSYFQEDTWKYLEDQKLDCVVLDCTMVEKSGVFSGHMGFPDNVRVRERMLRMRIASEKTIFVATHFYHGFNPKHERIAPFFGKKGFIAAYDGLEIEF